MTYYNLGQYTKGRLCYFRSTDIEQNNWHRLLWSVPDEMLYHLSLGKHIVIKDISSNKGKIEHIFIPVLNDILNYYISKSTPINNKLLPSFWLAFAAIENDKMLKTKIKLWTRRIKKPACIKGITKHVNKEPNTIYTKGLA